MSVKCMAAVWEFSEAKGGERLVLLAVADHAKHDGTGAWPSLTTLCTMTKFSERNVRYLLRRLEEMGELVIGYGEGPRGTNLYRVTLPSWHPEIEDTEGAKIAPAKIAPRQNRVKGGAKFSQGGGKIASGGGQPLAPEPSLEPSIEPSIDPAERVRALPRLTLETYCPDRSLLEGLGEERPDLSLPRVIDSWRDYHRERGTAIKDFNASLRRWVRNEKHQGRASPNGKHANGFLAHYESIVGEEHPDGPQDIPAAIDAAFVVGKAHGR